MGAVITINLGSLGYMCNFDFARCHETVLSKLMTGIKPKMDTRLRLRIGLDGAPEKRIYTGPTEDNYTDVQVENTHCMSEILISRGPSPYPVDLELYIDGIHVTSKIGQTMAQFVQMVPFVLILKVLQISSIAKWLIYPLFLFLI